MTATRMLVLVLLGVLIFVALLVMELTTRSLEADDEPDRVVAAQGVPSAITVPTTTSSTTSTTVQPKARTAPIRAASVRPLAVGEIPNLIRQVFGRFGADVGDQAVKVFGCETGGTYNPRATNGSHAGLAQISKRYHMARIQRLGFTWEQMFEALPNLTVAADIFGEQGWRPWTCRRVLA